MPLSKAAGFYFELPIRPGCYFNRKQFTCQQFFPTGGELPANVYFSGKHFPGPGSLMNGRGGGGTQLFLAESPLFVEKKAKV